MYLKIQSNDCLWSINMALTRHSYPNLHSRKDPTWITVSVHIRSYFITKREYEFDSYLIILSILCIIVLLLLHSAQAQFSSCSATDQKERTWRKFYYYYYKAVGGGQRGIDPLPLPLRSLLIFLAGLKTKLVPSKKLWNTTKGQLI